MKLTIYKKIMMGFGAVIIIMIISSLYVLSELNTVADGAKTILSSNVRTQELARQLKALIQDENQNAEKYRVSNDETYFSLFVESRKQVDDNLGLLLEKQSSKEEKQLIHGMRKAHDSFVMNLQKKDNNEIDINQGQGYERQKNMDILQYSLDFLISRNQSSIGKEMTRIESITARSAQVALFLFAGTLFAAITAALIITGTITRPIGDLIKGTEQIAQGKFEKVLVSSNDEIALLADAVNDMSHKINDVNELRTQMMQQISHELRTPLQAIQSAHDVLEVSGSIKAKQLPMLDAINRGIEKISDFSMQYIDLAKIESGVMQYNMKMSNLVNIIEPIVDEAKLLAAPKNINIELDSIVVPKVMLDTQKVSIIVSNLISNAIKYTRKNGNIQVRVGHSNGGVQIEVQDSGIGIDKDELSDVFMRFYQASNIKEIKSMGSGIGLAMVKAYAEGHGGKVFVDSSPDKGSSFKVEFPLAAEPSFRVPENTKLS